MTGRQSSLPLQLPDAVRGDGATPGAPSELGCRNVPRGKIGQMLICACWLQELRDAVWEIVKYRANLAATLKDTRTVVGKLERFMAIVVQFLFLFLYLLVWNVRLPPSPKQVPARATG